MELPEYISKSEVRRVCAELGIRDWTELTESSVTLEEAAIIQAELGSVALEVTVDEFRGGLEVELEHGLRFADANVTNNHPLLTGKIVLAHLREMLDYYARLLVAELEGDMFKALVAGDTAKLAAKYAQALEARSELTRSEASRR
ncbi:MAG: hypothetical protein HKN07_15410 [Acidimicrobiia bacterium]|nr:hypothetical protein [Acidimicrobiia bacterium]NNF65630.1 hypothetical protein [Acidimicrobiia bacterium]